MNGLIRRLASDITSDLLCYVAGVVSAGFVNEPECCD
jgi:hypothetical protein